MANIASIISLNVQTAGLAVAIGSIKELGEMAVATAITTDKMKLSMEAASGSAERGAKNLDYVKEVSSKMGLNVVTAAEAFTKLTAATKGTSLAGEETRKIFESFSAANVKLGGSSADLQGILQALEQMVSKGKVSMEELRGQLGERLPGAMRLAATSMGYTTAELEKLVATGTITAEELLPKLSDAVGKIYNDGKFDNAAASVNRLSNSFLELKQALVDSDWVSGGADFLAWINEVLVRTTKAKSANRDFLEDALAGHSNYYNWSPKTGNVRKSDEDIDKIKLQELEAEIKTLGDASSVGPTRAVLNNARRRDIDAEIVEIKERIKSRELDIAKDLDLQREEANKTYFANTEKVNEHSFKSFERVTKRVESSDGTNPNMNVPHDGGVVGVYQQKPPFMKQYNPGGDVNEATDQLVALQNFYEETRKKYDNNMVYVFGEYINGMTLMKKWNDEATKSGKSLGEVWEKNSPKTFADAANRTKMFNIDNATGKNDEAEILQSFEKKNKASEQFAKKVLEAERMVRTTTIKMKDDEVKDDIERARTKERADIDLIDNAITRHREEGTLTVQMESDFAKQKVIIHNRASNEIEGINEKRTKAEAVANRRRLDDEEAAAKQRIRVERSVDKFENEAMMELARQENRKTDIVNLQYKAQKKIIQDRYEYEVALARGNAILIERIDGANLKKLAALDKQYKKDMIDSNGSYFEKLQKHFTDVEASSGTMANQLNTGLADISVNAFNGLGDSIAEFATTGKANFKDFALSVLKDIEMMIAKMLIMKAISALMNMIPGGGAVGGSLSSLGSSSMSSMSSAITPSFSAMPMAKGGAFDKGVQFFAKGGIFDGPTLFEHAGGLGVAGEAGAEAIMPLTRDGSGVLGVKASGKQTSSNNVNLGAVNITINAKDEATASELKAQLINTIHTEFNKAIKNAQRPGNALNRHQLV